MKTLLGKVSASENAFEHIDRTEVVSENGLNVPVNVAILGSRLSSAFLS